MADDKKVTSITEAKGRRAGAKADTSTGTKEGKIPFKEKEENFLAAMRGYQTTWAIEFPETYCMVEDEYGVRLPLLKTKDDVLVEIHQEKIIDQLLWYSRQKLTAESDKYILTPEQASTIYKVFKATDNALSAESIPAIRQKSEPGVCWSRLPFDILPGECPTWDEIMSRMSNNKAYMAFIGSLLVGCKERQNYIWVYGDGNNSKGSMNRILARVFGKSYRPENQPDPKDRFWTRGLVGARLVVFTDFQELTPSKPFILSGIFKQITGGDPVRYEVKGGAVSKIMFDCKVMFFSDEKPDYLTTKKADQRRALYCELKELSNETVIQTAKDFDARLWSETSAFFFKCIETWEKETKNGKKPITNCDESREYLESMAEEKNSPYQDFFDEFFYMDTKEGEEPKKDYERCYILAKHMQMLLELKRDKWTRYEHHQWRKWLDRTMRCKFKKVRGKKDKEGREEFWRGYVGLSFNNEALNSLMTKTANQQPPPA